MSQSQLVLVVLTYMLHGWQELIEYATHNPDLFDCHYPHSSFQSYLEQMGKNKV